MQVVAWLVVTLQCAGAARLGLLRVGPLLEKPPTVRSTEFGRLSSSKDVKNSVRELLYHVAGPASISFSLDFSFSMSYNYGAPTPLFTRQPSPTGISGSTAPSPYLDTLVPITFIPTGAPVATPSVPPISLGPSLSPSLLVPSTSLGPSLAPALAADAPGNQSGTGADLQVATGGVQDSGPAVDKDARTAMLAVLAVALAAVAAAFVARKMHRKGKRPMHTGDSVTDVSSQIPTPA